MTVQEMGWSGMKNSDLLAVAAKQFDIFITADKQLPYQQNLSKLQLAIIILPTNQVPLVVALLPAQGDQGGPAWSICRTRITFIGLNETRLR